MKRMQERFAVILAENDIVRRLFYIYSKRPMPFTIT